MTYPFGRGWARAMPYLGMAVGMLLYVAFSFGPSLATVVFSFTNISGVPDAAWSFIGLANYKEFFSSLTLPDSDVVGALQRTLIFSAAVTSIQNALSLLIASLLNARIRGRMVVRALVLDVPRRSDLLPQTLFSTPDAGRAERITQGSGDVRHAP